MTVEHENIDERLRRLVRERDQLNKAITATLREVAERDHAQLPPHDCLVTRQ